MQWIRTPSLKPDRGRTIEHGMSGSFPWGNPLAVEEIEPHGVHLGYAVTERHIPVDDAGPFATPRICKQISLTLVVTLVLAAGGYYYAITPHHTSAPPNRPKVCLIVPTRFHGSIGGLRLSRFTGAQRRFLRPSETVKGSLRESESDSSKRVR